MLNTLFYQFDEKMNAPFIENLKLSLRKKGVHFFLNFLKRGVCFSVSKS